MIAFLKKRGIPLAGIFASMTVVVMLTGCGGSTTQDQGYAPNSLENATLQLIFGPADNGDAPSMLNIYGSGGANLIYTGTEYNSVQIQYSKTGPNTATVAVGHSSPPIGTPWTEVFSVTADITFNEGSVRGTITRWTFDFRRANSGGGYLANGSGSSGSVIYQREG